MKNDKKFIKKVISISLAFSFLCVNINAYEGNNSNSISPSNVYEEKGQFSYEYFKATGYKKNIENISKDMSNYDIDTSYDDPMVSEALFKEINRLESQGEKIEAIGYTKVYLKDIEVNGKSEVVPMTTKEVNEYREKHKNDVQPYATGSSSHSPGKNFTLYTVATNSGSKITGSSVGQYKTYTFQGQSEAPVNGKYDYISLTMPSQYTLSSSSVKGSNYGTYKADETNNAVCHGVLLKASISVPGKTSATLSGTGIKNSNVNAKKVISNYVHNYNSIKLSISFSATGASFSVSPENKTWKIASSVTIY